MGTFKDQLATDVAEVVLNADDFGVSAVYIPPGTGPQVAVVGVWLEEAPTFDARMPGLVVGRENRFMVPSAGAAWSDKGTMSIASVEWAIVTVSEDEVPGYEGLIGLKLKRVEVRERTRDGYRSMV